MTDMRSSVSCLDISVEFFSASGRYLSVVCCVVRYGLPLKSRNAGGSPVVLCGVA